MVGFSSIISLKGFFTLSISLYITIFVFQLKQLKSNQQKLKPEAKALSYAEYNLSYVNEVL
jgi:hypothetical protein